MRISEFAKILEESFSTFFGCKIITEINFDRGEFSIEGYIERSENWNIKDQKISLYDIRVIFTNDYDPKPNVIYIDSNLLGEISRKVNYTLEYSIIYIKEHLATVKSKAIYENL